MVSKKVSISLPEDTLEAIGEYTKAQEIASVSEAVVVLIEAGLKGCPEPTPAQVVPSYDLNDYFRYAAEEYLGHDGAKIAFSKQEKNEIEMWEVVVSLEGSIMYQQNLGRELDSESELRWGSYRQA